MMVFIGKTNNYMFRPKAAIFRLSQLQFSTLSHTCSLSHTKPNAPKPRTSRHNATLEAENLAENNNPEEEGEKVKQTNPTNIPHPNKRVDHRHYTYITAPIIYPPLSNI
jgi:hypothetical protein